MPTNSTLSILGILDRCAGNYSFPMLDNGYVYLAATRMALFRSETDWAITTEVFGFSPRAGVPDLCIATFGSSIVNRKTVKDYVSPEAHAAYLERQPHDESEFLNPLEEGDWIEEEAVSLNASSVRLRGETIALPSLADYAAHGIKLEDPAQAKVFEFCRWLAAERRSQVLATPEEQRLHVPPDLVKILELDEWRHPDTVNDEMPGDTETFHQLAQVLVHGEVSLYRPTELPNTHWSHWPDGGTL